MYGLSYINAVTLNNGGSYISSSGIQDVNKNLDSIFAMFTIDNYGLLLLVKVIIIILLLKHIQLLLKILLMMKFL